MRVLVLGGTQFFGREIVRMLSEEGHTVGVFTRGNRSLSDLPPHQHIQGDRDSIDDLRRAAETDDWDAVIDNIAYNAQHVRNALKAFSGTSHYVLCSTVAVYRFAQRAYPWPLGEKGVAHDSKPASEDPNDIHWKYARGKLEAERECMHQRKVPWTILRPPVVYGPHDPTERGFWYLSRLLAGGPLLLADGGVQSFRIISSQDTARAFVQVLENRKQCLRKAYFLGQSEIITLRDFVEESARALGIVPDYMDIPFDLLGDLGGPWSTMVNIVPDISAAKKDFDFSPTPFEEFIHSTAHWYRDHWRGDKKKLLETREKELALATKWKKLVASLRAVPTFG
jgi:nucleoside-diphosphate-sugar epimerase